jgi:hypothetical protein
MAFLVIIRTLFCNTFLRLWIIIAVPDAKAVVSVRGKRRM